jgi:hypothetical protein
MIREECRGYWSYLLAERQENLMVSKLSDLMVNKLSEPTALGTD